MDNKFFRIGKFVKNLIIVEVVIMVVVVLIGVCVVLFISVNYGGIKCVFVMWVK